MDAFLIFNTISILTWLVVFFLCFIRRAYSIKRLVFIPILVSLTLLIVAAVFFTEDKWLTVELLSIHIVAIVSASVLFNYIFSNLEEEKGISNED